MAGTAKTGHDLASIVLLYSVVKELTLNILRREKIII